MSCIQTWTLSKCFACHKYGKRILIKDMFDDGEEEMYANGWVIRSFAPAVKISFCSPYCAFKSKKALYLNNYWNNYYKKKEVISIINMMLFSLWAIVFTIIFMVNYVK